MYIIVFREGTLSFHFRGTPHPQNVRRRIKQLKDYINVTSDWISYALIDDITDAFGPLIQSIEYEVDSIDELVLILKEAEQSDMLRRIGTCRKKVMGLLRLMGNKADVVKGLAKRCNENWSVAPKSDIGLYLSDIQDHLITMTQNLNHYEKILSRSHSNYLAQISIEMTDANNQINDVLSKLTALGTVIRAHERHHRSVGHERQRARPGCDEPALVCRHLLGHGRHCGLGIRCRHEVSGTVAMIQRPQLLLLSPCLSWLRRIHIC